jgi:hypothetical protein
MSFDFSVKKSTAEKARRKGKKDLMESIRVFPRASGVNYFLVIPVTEDLPD